MILKSIADEFRSTVGDEWFLDTPEDLATRIEIDEREITYIISRYPMCINPYYLSLIKNKGDGIFRQAILIPSLS